MFTSPDHRRDNDQMTKRRSGVSLGKGVGWSKSWGNIGEDRRVPSPLYDCDDPAKRVRGIGAAQRALTGGMLVVMPTDTVYGLAADAFAADAVAALLTAKGRGRDMPVPVLVGSVETLDGAAIAGDAARELVRAFWPGGLTVVWRQQPSLNWDLGDTRGTVAVRMPAHEVALELLTKTGPLAVSSAN